MKNYIKFTFIAIVSILTIYSCSGNEKTQDQLKQLEVLQKTTDSLSIILTEIKFDSLALKAMDMAKDKKAIKTNFHSDTVNVSLARKINRFNGIRKQLKKASSKGLTFKNKLNLRKEKLSKLKADIEHQAGSPEKYDEYVQLETKNVNELATEFKAIHELTTRNLKEYEEIMPFIKAFIEDIRTID